MATQVQFRRGTTAELSSVTGTVGELFVDTTKDTVVVMDGSTSGGKPLATEQYVGTAIGAASIYDLIFVKDFSSITAVMKFLKSSTEPILKLFTPSTNFFLTARARLEGI